MNDESDKKTPDDPGRRQILRLAAGLAAAAAADSVRAATDMDVVEKPEDELPTVLITGANRGLGFEFSGIYADAGWRVIATCRRPASADALNALAARHEAVSVEALDVADHAAIDDLAARYRQLPIDVLLNNAGISGGGAQTQVFGRLQYEVFDDVMRVNAIGPLKMAEAFRDHVRASQQKKIITVSSSQGSIASVRMPMLYWYRSSKSAVNMMMTNLALQLKRRGVIVGLVTPGVTATDFIDDATKKRIPGIREPAVAAADMFRNIERFTLENTGSFFNYDGEIIPW